MRSWGHVCKAPCQVVCCGNTTLWAFEKSPPFLPIFTPVILNFELFHCSTTLSKLSLMIFWNGKNGANEYFPGFVALEVVWQRRPSTKARNVAWLQESHVKQLPKIAHFILWDTGDFRPLVPSSLLVAHANMRLLSQQPHKIKDNR